MFKGSRFSKLSIESSLLYQRQKFLLKMKNTKWLGYFKIQQCLIISTVLWKPNFVVNPTIFVSSLDSPITVHCAVKARPKCPRFEAACVTPIQPTTTGTVPKLSLVGKTHHPINPSSHPSWRRKTFALHNELSSRMGSWYCSYTRRYATTMAYCCCCWQGRSSHRSLLRVSTFYS